MSLNSSPPRRGSTWCAACLLIAGLAMAVPSGAEMFANQAPAAGGGVGRWSKLWVDPLGQNNLDGDAICYEDFVLANPSQIDHIEWWGDSVPDLGFQIEFWKQDPGTIAYQPWAVFRETVATPEAAFTTTNFTFAGDPTNTIHFSLDLASPISLAANDATNPRWFVAIIGLTDVPYLEWLWSQGLGGSSQTFQFVRGGNEGGGDLYRRLGDGRAMVLSGNAVPEPLTLAVLGLGSALVLRRRRAHK